MGSSPTSVLIWLIDTWFFKRISFIALGEHCHFNVETHKVRQDLCGLSLPLQGGDTVMEEDGRERKGREEKEREGGSFE